MLPHYDYSNEYFALKKRMDRLRELEKLYWISFEHHFCEKYSEREIVNLLGEYSNYEPSEILDIIFDVINDMEK